MIKALKEKGITCNSCWWREGDRCYAGEPERETGENEGEEKGRSKVFANEVCEQHTNKRKVLNNIFGDFPMTIVSEENAKKDGKILPNY